MKREIELSKTSIGSIINSGRLKVICTYQEILKKIFPNEYVEKAEIFAYHCKNNCSNERCKEKELLTL